MPMVKSKKDDDDGGAAVHRMVPSAWVSELRTLWHQAHETEVEIRVGTRGAWHPLQGSRMALTAIDGETDDRLDSGLALTHAQSAYDKAWAFRDEIGKRCDAKLLIFRHTGKGYELLATITSGGRLDDDGAEDIPDDYGGTLSPVRVWDAAQKERDSLVGHVDKLSGQVVHLAMAFKDVMFEVRGIFSGIAEKEAEAKAAEADAASKAYRAERGFDALERLFEKFEPTIKQYANTRHAESLLRTPRPKTGIPVVDAWNALISALDLPTAAMLRARFGDAGGVLVDRLSEADVDAAAIVSLWSELRTDFSEGWKEVLAALPGGVRESLVLLAAAVKTYEASHAGQGQESTP